MYDTHDTLNGQKVACRLGSRFMKCQFYIYTAHSSLWPEYQCSIYDHFATILSAELVCRNCKLCIGVFARL
jgi:hypothetical protein